MSLAPNTDNYVLGKGVPYFSRLLADGSYEGERDLGNTPNMTLTAGVNFLEHFSSRTGTKKKDKKIVEQVEAKIQFTLEEVNVDNLADWALGDIVTVTQASGTGLSVAVTSKKGRYFDLGKRDVDNVTIASYTEGVDFTVDEAIGRVYIPETSTISDDTELTVGFNCAAATYKQIRGLKESEIEGFFRFVTDNPAGPNYELKVWRVLLSPTGDLSLIGDDWTGLQFEGELLADETGHPNSPYVDINEIPA